MSFPLGIETRCTLLSKKVLPQGESDQKMIPLCFDLLEQRAVTRITFISSRKRKPNTALQQMLTDISYATVFLFRCLQCLPHTVHTSSKQNASPAIHSLCSSLLIHLANRAVPKNTLSYIQPGFAYERYRISLHRQCYAFTNLQFTELK